ncbi:MAG TPA: YdcF family protein [Actinomycetota bacterium]|nr:YdcF family protein [Actinomycetota bacterium]
MGALHRHPLVLASLFAVLAAVGVVVGTGIAVWRAAHIDAASHVDHADAIVVLGAAQYDGRPSPVFAGRLEHGALLYREGRAPTVLVLGGSRPGDVSTEADAGASYLEQQGVAAKDVVPIPEGNTTLESLRAAAAYMRGHDLRSAFLVSDPWHNLRIERMASDLGIVGYASATWHSAARSEGTRLDGYVRETFAYLYYRLFHR